MALFNRDYDRNYGYRGRTTAGYGGDYRTRGLTRDTGYRSTWGATNTGYDRGYGYGGTAGTYRGTTAYDRGYTAQGYDRNYKSRAQTDLGDPFGDRQSQTPIRVVDQGRESGWGGWWGGGRDYDRNYSYDRQYGRNPVGYDPYDTTYRGGVNRGYGGYGGSNRGYRATTRDYDRGWF